MNNTEMIKEWIDTAKIIESLRTIEELGVTKAVRVFYTKNPLDRRFMMRAERGKLIVSANDLLLDRSCEVNLDIDSITGSHLIQAISDVLSFMGKNFRVEVHSVKDSFLTRAVGY